MASPPKISKYNDDSSNGWIVDNDEDDPWEQAIIALDMLAEACEQFIQKRNNSLRTAQDPNTPQTIQNPCKCRLVHDNTDNSYASTSQACPTISDQLYLSLVRQQGEREKGILTMSTPVMTSI